MHEKAQHTKLSPPCTVQHTAVLSTELCSSQGTPRSQGEYTLPYSHGDKQEGHKEEIHSAVIVVPGGTDNFYGQREWWQYLLIILQDVTQSKQHQSHWQY